MRISNLSKFVGAGILAATVAVVPFNLPASAQNNTSTDNTTTTTAPNQGVDNTNRENNFDWGWLGLLGLGGLAGLAGRKRNDEVRYRTDDEVRTTNYGR
ncbi:MAG TPA: WGxxGxxG family protein [Coleofasciculaceae cyanobacterium]|jgi:LPXTG-motif cell wall-anchored protein